MALTLLESALASENKREKGIYKIIAETSPVAEIIPWISIGNASALSYKRQATLPGYAFRGVHETWPNSIGTWSEEVDRVVIMGGEVKIDIFQLKTNSSAFDLKAEQWKMKAQALSLGFTEAFFEGDPTSNPRVFKGLRNRLGTSQTVYADGAGSAGAALSLDALDNVLEKVIGDSGKTVFLNKRLRRVITALGRNEANGYSYIDTGNDAFGRQVMKYAGYPLRVTEREDNEATILDFDETVGGGSTNASIYVIRFGENYVSGIVAGGSGPTVYQVAKEMESEPSNLGRIEWYITTRIKHPRSAARLAGITNAFPS
ncbi:MAG: major capsid protein [Gammaproteobacteria bacterium]